MSHRISGYTNIPLHLPGKALLPVLQNMDLWKIHDIMCNCSSVLFRSTEILTFIEGDMLSDTGDCGTPTPPYWGMTQISHPMLFLSQEKYISVKPR